MQENRCPTHCGGYLTNRWDLNYGKWREECTSCNFSRLHRCRRKRQIDIDFNDRRARNEGGASYSDTSSS